MDNSSLIDHAAFDHLVTIGQPHLDLALQAGSVGIWKWDYKTNKISWSKQLEAIYGLEEGQFDGSFECWSSFLFPEDLGEITAGFNQLEFIRHDVEREFRIRKKNNETAWILSRMRNVFGKGDKLDYALGVNIDITSRKLAEEKINQLLERETQLRLECEFEKTRFHEAFMNSPAAVCLFSGSDQTIEFANHHFLSLLGKATGEVHGKVAKEILTDDKLNLFLARLSSVYESGEMFRQNEEFLIFNANQRGSQGHFKYIITPLRNAGKNVSGLMCIILDITFEVKSKILLQQNEERLKIAAQLTQLGTWDSDVTTGEVSWSEECRIVLGARKDTVPSYEAFTNAIHPLDYERVMKAINDAIDPAVRQPFDIEFRFTGIDEKFLKWIHTKGTVYFDETNVPYRFFGINFDITSKKLQTEMLEQAVAEKTKNLNQTISKLKASNSELEQFAYVASHDLQQPLRKIETFARILADKEEIQSPSSSDIIQKIIESTRRMQALMDGLLSFSKVSTVTTQFAATDLNLSLKSALSDLEIEIALKGAVVKFQNLPVIEAIAVHMHQLFLNLIGNALKFSKEGRPPVIHIDQKKLTAKEKKDLGLSSARKYVLIVVADNGIGFDQSQAEKIFEIFNRLEQKHRPGHGIGLAVCQKIVTIHQGKIHALSRRDLGTEFYVILPATQNA